VNTIYIKDYIFILLSALMLSACGGGGATEDEDEQVISSTIGGNVSGLTGTLSLQNNEQDTLQLNTNGVYTFATPLAIGATYNVTVSQQPAGQTCNVNNSSGAMGNADVTNVSVACVDSFNVGGNISGITGDIIISNNGGISQRIFNNGEFTLGETLGSGGIYNVQIIQPPLGQVCSITNGSGQVVSSDVSDVSIICSDTADTNVNLSGSIQLVQSQTLDIDVNDPATGIDGDNDTFTTPQVISNQRTVQGFASRAGTGFSGDRFRARSDQFDVFHASLEANQNVQLHVVDFAGADLFTGDLDLAIYDQNLNLVASSDSITEFEIATPPSSGRYYIVVSAFSGSSKYSLTLGSPASVAAKQGQLPDFVPNEVIVKFKPNSNITQFRANNRVTRLSHTSTSRPSLAQLPENRSFGTARSAFMQQLKTANSETYQKLRTLRQIKDIRLRENVEFAEPNFIRRALRVPNDQYYNAQWHYPAINLPQAWDITTGSRIESDVIVSVIDTGVYLAHPDFNGQLVGGYDFISDPDNAVDGNGIDDNPDDPGDGQNNPLVTTATPSSWHGTHVAGTIAARSNDGSGVAGVSWNAKIMPMRVLGALGGTSYDINQALRFSAGLPNDSGTVPPQAADIINLSLGGGGYSQAEQDIYNQLYAQGVIVVAAAGNENTSQLSYPASYDGVISVSAMDFNKLRAPYSNFGPRIDVGAPGGNPRADENQDQYPDGVLSAVVDPSNGTLKPAWNFNVGTSMASPHVAGVFALMRAVHPTISPSDIDSLLASGSITQDLGAAGRDDIYGHGFIDALKAVQEAQSLATSGQPVTQPALIVATPSSLALGLSNNATILLDNQGGESASVTNSAVSASWLSVSPLTVGGNGLGRYELTVNRAGLVGDNYSGQVTFTLSNGNSLQVRLTMQVGTAATNSSVGKVYILLLDTNNEAVQSASPVYIGNGVFNYSFDGVSPNTYRIIAGTDIDNDFFICQYAEACGGYPYLSDLADIKVTNQDLTNLDYTAEILSSFGSQVQSVGEQAPQSIGYSRPLGKHLNDSSGALFRGFPDANK